MREIFSTHHWPHRSEWAATVDSVDPAGLSRAALVRRILAAARRYPVLVLNGSLGGYADVAAAALVARRRRPPRIVLTDCTWKAGEGPLARARQAAVRALDGPHVTYCVLSTAERSLFPRTWGVDADRVAFTPWYVGLSEEELADPPEGDEGFVFAGGDSLRDYGPLLAAAPRLGARLTIASRTLGRADVPEGVDAGPVSPERFTALTRSAATVVVPLEARRDRSAGQFTYLNAMALGKPVVVTDAPGVRDHVDDRRTGLVVPAGDPDALASAVAWTVAPATRAEAIAMGGRARADVLERFSPERYVDRLLELAGAQG